MKKIIFILLLLLASFASFSQEKKVLMKFENGREQYGILKDGKFYFEKRYSWTKPRKLQLVIVKIISYKEI